MTIPIATTSPLMPIPVLRPQGLVSAGYGQPAFSAGKVQDAVDWAQRIHKLLPPAKFDKLGGFSLEDLSFRGGLVFAVYAPQQYLAMKYKQQPWETFLRNTLVLIGSLTIIHYSRGPFNTFVNQFMMRRKETRDLPKIEDQKGLKKMAAWFEHKLFNPHRPQFNYLESLFEAGIKLESLGIKFAKPSADKINSLDGQLYKLFKENAKPVEFLKRPENKALRAHLMSKLDREIAKKVYWSSMDLGRKKVVLDFRKQLLEQAAKLPENASQRKALELAAHKIETTMKRMFQGRFAGAMISALFTAMVVGIWIQQLVFKLAAPLDKKYQPIVPGRDTVNRASSAEALPQAAAASSTQKTPLQQPWLISPLTMGPYGQPQPMMPLGGRPWA